MLKSGCKASPRIPSRSSQACRVRPGFCSAVRQSYRTVGWVVILLSWPITLHVARVNRAGAAEPDAPLRTLRLEARDLVTNVPVQGVLFQLNVAGGAKSELRTDGEGIARFEYRFPKTSGRHSFHITAHGEGLVPLFAQWFPKSDTSNPPEHLLFQTEKGTTLGGRVLDQDSQPLEGAVVVLNVSKRYSRSEQHVNIGYESIKTDASGRWSFTGVPEQPDSVEIAAYDYLHLTENSSFQLEPYRPISALRDGSAVLRLQRGTLIQGTVLAPDGQPVKGAKVAYGEGVGYGNSIPPLKTDDKGRFTLGIKPGTIATLVAQAPGFAPTLQHVKVGGQSLDAYLTLESPHSLRGQVVDPSGKPLARARVLVYWSGLEGSPRSSFGVASRAELTTNEAGRFEWKGAPSKGIMGEISKLGYTAKGPLSLATDVDQKIVLTTPTQVNAKVTDRDTGEPLSRFALTWAVAWEPGDPLIWQSGEQGDAGFKKSQGAFEGSISSRAHRYLIRVRAEGYLPEDSEPFSIDGSTLSLAFRLQKGEPIRGAVRNPDGSPARDGFVYLVPSHKEGWIDYLSLENDDVPARLRSYTTHVQIKGAGEFVLPPQKENFALLAITSAGYALAPRRDLLGAGVATLQLQPWARVTGTIQLDGKPAANLKLQGNDSEDASLVENMPRLVRQTYVKTDADGHFELPHVMAGPLRLAEYVTNGVYRRVWPVNRVTLDVEAGRTYDLNIGSSGRVVMGQLTRPRSDDWMIRKAEIVSRDKGADRPAKYGVELLEEGRFRAIDLQPGDYTLRVALHEPPPPNSCGWGRVLGEYHHNFTVPKGAEASDPPLDLGQIESVADEGPPLKVGDLAPDFTVKTLSGEELKLADYRGKYVLLDFWASWCAPCLAEMPNLQTIQDQYASDPRFVVIGLSLDEEPSRAASAVKALKLSWRQGIVEPDAPTIASYGASAIPATFLIGPDGRILARDLRGQKTRTAVVEALQR